MLVFTFVLYTPLMTVISELYMVEVISVVGTGKNNIINIFSHS